MFKRRRLQFGLRTVIVLVTIACGLLARWVNRSHDQHVAADVPESLKPEAQARQSGSVSARTPRLNSRHIGTPRLIVTLGLRPRNDFLPGVP
jgi:hypothetical protein